MTPPATMSLIGNIRYDDAKVKMCSTKTFFYPFKGASGFLVKFSIKIQVVVQVMLIQDLFLCDDIVKYIKYIKKPHLAVAMETFVPWILAKRICNKFL